MRIAIVLLLISLLVSSVSAQTIEIEQGTAEFQTVDAPVPLLRVSGQMSSALSPVTLEFSIRDAVSGVDSWSETTELILDSNGRFSVLLGKHSAQGIPADAFSGETAQVLVCRRTDGTQIASWALLPTAYAFASGDARRLGGRPASEYVLASSLQGTSETYSPATYTTSDGDTSAVFGQAISLNGTAAAVRGSSLSTSGTGMLAEASSTSGLTVGLHAKVSSQDGIAAVLSAPEGGNFLLGVAGGNRFRIDASGRGYFNNGVLIGGADWAELIDAKATYEPGDVLVIDRSSKRTVALSTEAYSTRVAGIYSTRPGVVASNVGVDVDESKKVPLAITGIVQCKVTAENGAIRPGDILVTSSTPGHAMKGRDASRLHGAIVGKALEALSGEIGLIEVLITLN